MARTVYNDGSYSNAKHDLILQLCNSSSFKKSICQSNMLTSVPHFRSLLFGLSVCAFSYSFPVLMHIVAVRECGMNCDKK